MKKITYAIILILLAAAAGAQSLSPTVIASTGGFSSNSNGSLSYTVGEMTMVQTFSAGNYILTQGFQQPTDSLVLGLLDFAGGEYGTLVVYPNPAVDQFSYGYELPAKGKVTFRIYDAIGQLIAETYSGTYNGGKEILQANVSGWAAGVYFLQMTFTDNADASVHQITRQVQVLN